VAAGALTGAVVLAGIAFAIFRFGRKLPIRTFLSVAVVVVMATSVAFLGNAIYSLQEAAVIDFHRLDWPRLPIFLAQTTGYHPTTEVVVAQAILAAVYMLGALYMFVIRPRRQRTTERTDRAAGPAPRKDAVTGSPVAVSG
jgi:high-affinity Fe2+/Pb2+ permease